MLSHNPNIIYQPIMLMSQKSQFY